MFPVHEKRSVLLFQPVVRSPTAGDNWLSAACEAADNQLSLAVAFFLQIGRESHLLVTLLPHYEIPTCILCDQSG